MVALNALSIFKSHYQHFVLSKDNTLENFLHRSKHARTGHMKCRVRAWETYKHAVIQDLTAKRTKRKEPGPNWAHRNRPNGQKGHTPTGRSVRTSGRACYQNHLNFRRGPFTLGSECQVTPQPH